MRRKYLLGILTVTMGLSLSTSAFAAENAEKAVRPQGMYIRECVGYEPNYTTKDYTHKYVGSVSGDNRQGSSTMQITYVYETSGSTTASISGYANTSAEAGVVFAKMSAQAGIEVSASRSWSRGMSAGVSYGIAPGKFEELGVYIPAVQTSGRLKYKVYMDSNPSNIFYEYKTLSTSYAPMKNSIHYKVVKSSYSALNLPAGTTVYTPSGSYMITDMGK